MRTANVLVLSLAVLFVVAAPGSAGNRAEKPRKAFDRLSQLAQRADSDGFQVVFADNAFPRHMRDEQRMEARKELGALIADAKFVQERTGETEAVVAFQSGRSETLHEMLLRFERDEWRIAIARAYPVEGPELDRSRGKKPAKLTLSQRTSNDGYGASAFSFTHVTGDPAQCKNRMDLWYCHNNDFHTSGGTRIVDLGKKSLKKVNGIPVGADWKRTAAAEPGHVYALHCRDDSRRDFFVKLKVLKAKRGAIQIEWTLLSGGLNAPANIHEAQPLASNDGSDGCDGLCGKNG